METCTHKGQKANRTRNCSKDVQSMPQLHVAVVFRIFSEVCQNLCHCKYVLVQMVAMTTMRSGHV